MLLIIDNYDSFTYNLSHYFQALGQKVKVIRNDQLTLLDIEKLSPDYIVLSPGPCTPNESGICMAVIERFKGLIPILGVCLGHQCIAQAFGGKIIKAPVVMHGKTSLVQHQNSALFNLVSHSFTVTRYHSLIVERASLPENLVATAFTVQDQLIMALQHKHYPIWGVQFHPESVLSEFGHQILENFLNH